eukprot:c17377_g1_i3 orf=349-1266(+)
MDKAFQIATCYPVSSAVSPCLLPLSRSSLLNRKLSSGLAAPSKVSLIFCNCKKFSSYGWLFENNFQYQTLCQRQLRRAELFLLKFPPKLKVRAQLVSFKARREVNLPYKEGPYPAEDYIKETERIVRVTFPDSGRIQYLGECVWRARLKPVTFFTISATPFCDLKVFYDGRALQIMSNSLTLDFIGLSDHFRDLKMGFSLQGELTIANKNSLALLKGQKMFKGRVGIGLQVDLTFPFSAFPEAMVLPVGDGILDHILGAMEGALLAGIIRDYNDWCYKLALYSNKVSFSSNPEVYVGFAQTNLCI